jgi:hypothetical protein
MAAHRSQEVEWLFPQEKATFKEVGQGISIGLLRCHGADDRQLDALAVEGADKYEDPDDENGNAHQLQDRQGEKTVDGTRFCTRPIRISITAQATKK